MARVQKPIGFSPHEISSMVNEVVVRQHAENAAFLWTQRDRAISAPHYRLKDIAKLDERVEANVDGLRVAGDVGWRMCVEGLEQQGPGEVFAAAVLALGGNEPERIDKVFEVGQAVPGLVRPIVSALGWLEIEQIKHLLDNLLTSDSPLKRRVGIAGYAVHRLDPGRILMELLADGDVQVRSRALKAAGELGRMDLLPHVRRATADEDLGCRFRALWSAVRLGERNVEVLRALRAIAETDEEFSELALLVLLRSLSFEEGKQWRRQLRDDLGKLRLATKGIGIFGDPSLVPELLVLMERKETSRIAGESFSMLTGADLAYQDLERDEPQEPKSPGLNDQIEAKDDEFAMEITEDSDADLPWPDPELVGKWWRAHQGDFRDGVRYLCGKEMTTQNLEEVLKTGYQRQRAAAALELGFKDPRRALFEVRAQGRRQQQSLGLWSW